ncbi:MAG: TIGR00725 family protein [Chloroflexi bacterium]|nr:TIGR00725 family protein [Chloroflexota bacterium]
MNAFGFKGRHRDMSSIPLIAVVGGGQCSEEEARLAEEVGRLLAERGFGVVCGGRGGVMAAACRGAARAGGLTVGVLPGEDATEANPWVQIAIATGLGEARNAIVARAGLGAIAVGGEYGTLSEMALALKWGKPVAGLKTWPLPDVYAADSPEDAVGYVLNRIAKH